MNHFSSEEIKDLWEDSNGSWTGLIQSLESRENGQENEDHHDLIVLAKEMEDGGERFPDSPEELEEMVNENFPEHQHKMAM